MDLGLFIAAAAVLCAGCLMPNRLLPPLPNDKFMHFAGFAVLSVLALRLAHGRAQALCWLAGLLLGGWLIECLQQLVPDRGFCWRDMAANAAGIGVVAVGALLLGAPG
jgi:VanZ family protein